MSTLGNKSHLISGSLEYEQPNAFLQFSGKFIPAEPNTTRSSNDLPSTQAEPFAAAFSSVLLRGSVLRNTNYVEGIVLYAGVETKLVMSSKETPSKFSRIDVFINRLLGYTFIALVVTAFLATALLIGKSAKHQQHRQNRTPPHQSLPARKNINK